MDRIKANTDCEVYWGSHGCQLLRGHEGAHDCGCCDCENHPDPDSGCVGAFPYYGWRTSFYGDDAEAANEWFVKAMGMPALGACPACSKICGDGPDPCIGWIDGATGACCGHGNPDDAYAIMETGEYLVIPDLPFPVPEAVTQWR